MEWKAILIDVLVLLVTFIFTHVDSSSQLQIRIATFENPEWRTESGHCCRAATDQDGAAAASTAASREGSSGITCTTPCRTFFRVCASVVSAPAYRPARHPPPPPGIRISRIASRRRPRAVRARRDLFTDTPVPGALPPIGYQEKLSLPPSAAQDDETVSVGELPAPMEDTSGPSLTGGVNTPESNEGGSPMGGTTIRVVHRLISSAHNSSVEEYSQLSRRPLEDPLDIKLVFVEHDGFVRLYFEPESSSGYVDRPPGRDRFRRDRPSPTDNIDGSTSVTAASGLQTPDESVDVDEQANANQSIEEEGDSDDTSESGSSSSANAPVHDPWVTDQLESLLLEDIPDTDEGSHLKKAKHNLEDHVSVANPLREDLLPKMSCSMGQLVTGVLITNATRSDEDTGIYLSFPYPAKWPGAVKLSVEAWHDVTGQLESGDVILSHSSWGAGDLLQLISRTSVERRVRAGDWSRDRLGAGHTRLGLDVRLVCDRGSDGPHCASACDRHGGGKGHWQCRPDGSASCHTGWHGDQCNTPVCRPGCHPRQGYCRAPSECLCKIGYSGQLCSQCVPMPGCLHGRCVKSFECRCEPGWTGLFCNKPICAAGCDKDRGYCTRPNECRCRIGWTGKRCNKCKLMPGCMHGFCKRPLECKCRQGWTGFFCERAICSPGCSKQHGYCEQPAVCRCELGWTGPTCDECFAYPGCVHGNCSEPWECSCHPGWTGFLCDKPVDLCAYLPTACASGGTCYTALDDQLPTYRCLCPKGFTGPTCHLPADPADTLSGPPATTARRRTLWGMLTSPEWRGDLASGRRPPGSSGRPPS